MGTIVRANDIAPQPWRNGGGRTRELLALPDATHWRLRLSLADIERDGPFSAFPGVRRWFAVVSGAGVRLGLPDGERSLRPGDPPIEFDGAAAPVCTLIDGPTRDLNLMLRGATGVLRPALAGVPWLEPFAETFVQRGFFSAAAGTWQAADGARLPIEPLTLLWPAGEGCFVPHASGACCWWIGCSEGPA